MNAILAVIPEERRTPAVLNLMIDAAALGPDHCRDLVRWIEENWFRVHRPSTWACACGKPVSWLCATCPKCIELEEQRG